VADTFTSIATAGGWQTNTVKPAWDLAFRTALNVLPTCRQFVDVRPDRVTHTGDSQTLQITQNHTEATVTAAKTPLSEQVDPDAVQHPATNTVTLTPKEYGFLELTTAKLRNRSMVPLQPEVIRTVADHCYKVVDELLQDQMVLGTQVYRGGDRAATNLVTTGDTLTTRLIQLAVAKLRSNGAMSRDGEFYAGIVHPNVVFDIRREGGSGGWRVPNEYGNSHKLYRGEFGEWEGVRFIQNARARVAGDGASSGNVYRSYILGAEALAESVVVEPSVEISPIVDRFRRFVPIGWYGDFDFKVFRDKALVRLETATAAI
jgi:N4-gp56 family major capsid protein